MKLLKNVGQFVSIFPEDEGDDIEDDYDDTPEPQKEKMQRSAKDERSEPPK